MAKGDHSLDEIKAHLLHKQAIISLRIVIGMPSARGYPTKKHTC